MFTKSTESVESRPRGLDRVSFIILQITLFLTPIFFIPSSMVPLQIGKSTFILYGIIAAFVVWSVARLKDGSFHFPRSLFYVSASLVALSYTVSALLATNKSVSLAGTSLEIGTLSFLLPSLLLFALIPLVVRTQKQIFYSYVSLLASFLVVGMFHVLRFIFGADFLSFGIFTAVTSNMVGKWNDLGVLFGLSTLIGLITLEKAVLTRAVKIITYILLAVSVVMVTIVNFAPVWVTLAILSLVFFIYKFSFNKQHGDLGKRVPYHALAILIISIVFIFSGNKLGTLISNSLGTSQLEVRPSWSATYEIAKASLAHHPVFGTGPNRFSSEWLLNKPNGINNTLFWNVDFNYGIGFIPSFVVTTGIFGTVSILIFIVLFALVAFRALIRPTVGVFSRYLLLSSLFGSAYLWVFAISYVPSSTIWILTLALSGLFVASLREEQVIADKSFAVLGKPATSFVSVLLTILALIGAVSFGYFVTIKLFAGVYFQKAVTTLNSSTDLDLGQKQVLQAIALSPNDLYYRALTEVHIARLGRLFQNTELAKSDAQKQFQDILAAGIQSGQAAVKFDETNYQNHVSLGRVFEVVVPLGIEGAYESAKKSYEEAIKINPENPEIYLMLARLDVAKKDLVSAKANVTKAIEKKNDYADAIFLLAQIQISQNDVPNAINSVSAIATLSPNDPGVFFQLGLLYYNQKDYQNSVLAFERAITINKDYANAKYFLGLSYYQTNDMAKAIEQFKGILVTNPDSVEVKAIIKNLEANKPPFTAPAPSQAVSKTSKLPLKQ